ncbi:hypothetical protein WN48_08513 [Eufriesea mexicana]|uniref:Uncharacterized protein n=1 Tax=Eufriesea mexicana TaxID=516756 RepID=A0A310SP34_9HYME|nr:hypothetical protein WN48_08513 [Eufriesea mexicana]
MKRKYKLEKKRKERISFLTFLCASAANPDLVALLLAILFTLESFHQKETHKQNDNRDLLSTVSRCSPFDGCGSTDAPRDRVPIAESPFDAYWPSRDWSSIEFSSDAATRDLRSPVWHEDDVRRRL